MAACNQQNGHCHNCINAFHLFTFDSCYTWEDLTLDGLKQSTTTSRDVRYLVSQTELVDTSHRVTTTNQ